MYDLRKGHRLCKKLYKQYHFQIVHCRGYIPSILGKELKKRYGVKFIFDMRGWWADEKLESGFWDKKIYKPVYRYFKSLEKEFFQKCDYAVSLTFKGKEEIVNNKLADPDKTGVIPTCVDFEIFKPPDPLIRKKYREKLDINADDKVFVYSGSVGGNYDPDTLISVFKEFEQIYRGSYLLLLSKDNLSNNTKKIFLSAGIKKLKIYNVPFAEVTHYLQVADVGFVYYKISFSTIGRSPTKLGEYWAAGLPVIGFKGIGDLEHIISSYPGSGVLLSPGKEKWGEELKNLFFSNPDVLRKYSEDYFHIDKGVKFYKQIYESLVLSSNKIYEPIESSV